MEMLRPLTGVKVVELSTFVAAATAARFFADQGAEVIKVEPIGGDNLRYASVNDGYPGDPFENITFDLENGNKKSVSLNLKNPECYEILMQLIGKADLFLTNWRPKALQKMHLDYESLKEKFPKLVYGSITGYGEVGPDKDLPGYDATAFFANSGFLGSTYEKGTVPMNLIPSVGDRASGMALAAGLLASLYKAEKTGKGDKVTVSLYAMAVFVQATFLLSAQYGILEFPITKEDLLNPFMASYKTKDGRFIQLQLPVFDVFIKPFAKAMGREEWLENPLFCSMNGMRSGGHAGFYHAVQNRFSELTTEEADAILTKADLPHAVVKVWKEVLADEQAWATNIFVKQQYPSGERAMVRYPVMFAEEPLPAYEKAPMLGENTREVLLGLGYPEEKIEEMMKARDIVCYSKAD